MHVYILYFRTNHFIHKVCMPTLVCSSAHSHKVVVMPKLRSACAIWVLHIAKVGSILLPY